MPRITLGKIDRPSWMDGERRVTVFLDRQPIGELFNLNTGYGWSPDSALEQIYGMECVGHTNLRQCRQQLQELQNALETTTQKAPPA